MRINRDLRLDEVNSGRAPGLQDMDVQVGRGANLSTRLDEARSIPGLHHVAGDLASGNKEAGDVRAKALIAMESQLGSINELPTVPDRGGSEALSTEDKFDQELVRLYEQVLIVLKEQSAYIERRCPDNEDHGFLQAVRASGKEDCEISNRIFSALRVAPKMVEKGDKRYKEVWDRLQGATRKLMLDIDGGGVENISRAARGLFLHNVLWGLFPAQNFDLIKRLIKAETVEKGGVFQGGFVGFKNQYGDEVYNDIRAHCFNSFIEVHPKIKQGDLSGCEHLLNMFHDFHNAEFKIDELSYGYEDRAVILAKRIDQAVPGFVEIYKACISDSKIVKRCCPFIKLENVPSMLEALGNS